MARRTHEELRAAAVAIVLLGLALSAGLAVAGGLDGTGAIILASVVGVGALTIAVARRSGSGVVSPAECRACGGLVSPNASYCKHCGAELSPDA